MPDKAASYADGTPVKGPAGTAANRAVNKQGTIKGRESAAGAKVEKAKGGETSARAKAY